VTCKYIFGKAVPSWTIGPNKLRSQPTSEDQSFRWWIKNLQHTQYIFFLAQSHAMHSYGGWRDVIKPYSLQIGLVVVDGSKWARHVVGPQRSCGPAKSCWPGSHDGPWERAASQFLSSSKPFVIIKRGKGDGMGGSATIVVGRGSTEAPPSSAREGSPLKKKSSPASTIHPRSATLMDGKRALLSSWCWQPILADQRPTGQIGLSSYKPNRLCFILEILV